MDHEQIIMKCPMQCKPFRNNRKTISVDKGIAPVIAYLWNNGVITLGCCQGYDEQPNVVVFEDYHQEEIMQIRDIIAQVDDRDWQIFKWGKELKEQIK